MDQNIKDRWVKALRSGQYQQGNYYLRQYNQYCCLGILCELAERDGLIDGSRDLTGAYRYGKGTDTDHCGLPWSVQQWAGLEEDLPSIPLPEDEGASLAKLNDEGMPFAQIADLIEHFA